MAEPRRCSSCDPIANFGQVLPLTAIRAEVETVETLSREIQDLTCLLRATLPPDLFKLVWSLTDAVERLGLCESMLRERRLTEGLAQHLPDQSHDIRTLSRHIFTEDVPVDGTV